MPLWILHLILVAPFALAWSSKEHLLMTRLVVEQLLADPTTPPAMKQWIETSVKPRFDASRMEEFVLRDRVGVAPPPMDGLPFWSVEPDLRAKDETLIEPFGVNEQKLHFIDMEYLHPDESRRTYCDDLSSCPKLVDFPRDLKDERYKKAGVLPFAIETFHERLVKAFKAARVATPPDNPLESEAVKIAGQLAHYVQDNTQPHHGTEDYRGRSYFPRGGRAPNIHFDMEYRLLDDETVASPELRKEFWNSLQQALANTQDTADLTDLWKASLEVSIASYQALPVIGKAGVASYPKTDAGYGPWKPDLFHHFKGPFNGREMSVMEIKADRMAAAIKRVARLWRKAWDQAHATE